jgi:hypothetical protein
MTCYRRVLSDKSTLLGECRNTSELSFFVTVVRGAVPSFDGRENGFHESTYCSECMTTRVDCSR